MPLFRYVGHLYMVMVMVMVMVCFISASSIVRFASYEAPSISCFLVESFLHEDDRKDIFFTVIISTWSPSFTNQRNKMSKSNSDSYFYLLLSCSCARLYPRVYFLLRTSREYIFFHYSTAAEYSRTNHWLIYSRNVRVTSSIDQLVNVPMRHPLDARFRLFSLLLPAVPSRSNDRKSKPTATIHSERYITEKFLLLASFLRAFCSLKYSRVQICGCILT